MTSGGGWLSWLIGRLERDGMLLWRGQATLEQATAWFDVDRGGRSESKIRQPSRQLLCRDRMKGRGDAGTPYEQRTTKLWKSRARS